MVVRDEVFHGSGGTPNTAAQRATAHEGIKISTDKVLLQPAWAQGRGRGEGTCGMGPGGLHANYLACPPSSSYTKSSRSIIWLVLNLPGDLECSGGSPEGHSVQVCSGGTAGPGDGRCRARRVPAWLAQSPACRYDAHYTALLLSWKAEGDGLVCLCACDVTRAGMKGTEPCKGSAVE